MALLFHIQSCFNRIRTDPFIIQHILTFIILIFRITGSAFQSLGELGSAVNNARAANSDKSDGDKKKKPKETRYEANYSRVRRNSPVTRDMGYRKSFDGNGSGDMGPRKVPLGLPNYQNQATPTARPTWMRAQNAPTSASASSGRPFSSSGGNTVENGQKSSPYSYANYRIQKTPSSYDGSQIASHRSQGLSNDASEPSRSAASTLSSQMDSNTNSFDHLMAKNSVIDSNPSMNVEHDVSAAAMHNDFIDNVADESYIDDQFQEVRNLLKWNFEKLQNEQPVADQPIEQSTLPSSADVTLTDDENDDLIDADHNDKKFARRVSPCDQKLLFSPHTPSIPSYTSPSSYTYSSLPYELPGKLRNWEDDILKELRNRFYSCCEECKKKVMEKVAYCPPQTRADPQAAPLEPITPKPKIGDRDVAKKLQELVDSLSLEQKRNLARIYSKLPKQIV